MPMAEFFLYMILLFAARAGVHGALALWSRSASRLERDCARCADGSLVGKHRDESAEDGWDG